MKHLRKTPLIFLYIGLVLFSIFKQYNPKKQNYVTPKTTASLSPVKSVSPSFIKNHLVTRVIDGDTIEIDNSTIVRYIGINTPETKHPKKEIECFGVEASKKNAELVLNKYVKIEKDISEKDKYGRLLRYVWVTDSNSSSSSAFFVNEYLVREGYAYAASYPPDVKYQELFRIAQQKAIKENKGLWSLCK